jgi:hypothetical protein
VTDGSNADDLFKKNEPFEHCGVQWEPVGVLEDQKLPVGRRPTRVWRARHVG